MIEVEQLSKRYGDLTAVEQVSFKVEEGEIYGLLGPNGAGKSTTIGCISGLLPPTSGSIRVLSHDVVAEGKRARTALGIVPQELALYEELNARQNLEYWGGAWGLGGSSLKQRVTEVLERTGLADRAKEAIKGFSGGMQRRLNFGCGIVHRPRVLLLDEPTVGIDPQSRVRLLELVREEAAAGTCVLYTTHYMEEAEDLCDRLAIIDHGRNIAEGTLPELRSLLGERDLLRLNGNFEPEAMRAVRAALESAKDLEIMQVEAGQLTLALRGATRRLPEVFEALASAGCEVRETTLTQPSLESLFIKLTGKELRE